jgi:hypothetical protein
MQARPTTAERPLLAPDTIVFSLNWYRKAKQIGMMDWMNLLFRWNIAVFLLSNGFLSSQLCLKLSRSKEYKRSLWTQFDPSSFPPYGKVPGDIEVSEEMQ